MAESIFKIYLPKMRIFLFLINTNIVRNLFANITSNYKQQRMKNFNHYSTFI